MNRADAARWMAHAARIAWRGHGGAEPNPMVGCVIVAAGGQLVAEGHHRRCGGPHAEVEALRRAGIAARGATAVVTLEPCNHHGRTGPCSLALREAGVARVLYGCADPNPTAAGGAETLRRHGIDAEHLPHPDAARVTAPLLHRVRTGRPRVVAKWAESADGRIATRPGEPRWISGERSRAMVHRERARVDAVLTGMGTVMVDDPLLTVRGTRARRTPLRVVWAPRLGMPPDRAIVGTARAGPTLGAAPAGAIAGAAREADGLRAHGIDVLAAADEGALLSELGRRGVATVLVEAGSGLVRPMVARGLVNAAWVFTSPHELGDAGPRSAAPMTAAELSRLDCAWTGRRGDDRVSLYLFPA
ncbi:MAG: bifunctional diaminohydroxyphosphoribosylaminopyrimidine deaminase/5-amino-6-(5-phosphoribosylamino)uracil reductase RibD [Phycisphaerales bacterium]